MNAHLVLLVRNFSYSVKSRSKLGTGKGKKPLKRLRI